MSSPNMLQKQSGDLLRSMLSDPRLALARMAHMGERDFGQLASRLLSLAKQNRKEQNLRLYQPVSDKSMEVHTSTDKRIGVGGGNRSSKTETCVAEIAMCTTGVFAKSVRDRLEALDREEGNEPGTRLRAKFRGPINARIVCESLTTTLHQTILPKLQWWKWTGVDMEGGDRGHFGWIPRDNLIGGQWEKSWSEKLRVLRVVCRDPFDFKKVLGESTIEFFSHDQDPSDFASGQCHIVLCDEPPRYPTWRENEARTIAVGGRMFLAMTWPDDPAIPVDWVFDKLYEPAQLPDTGVKWINLWTTENPFIDQQAVAEQEAQWDEQTRQVRIYGRPIRFSNRVHPLFTDQEDWWCFGCGKTVLPAGTDPLTCSRCGGQNVVTFNHVRDFAAVSHWPTTFVLDPHPRKPHMYLWAQVDPADDIWVVACGECPGEPDLVREDVSRIESDLGLDVRRRLIDPNMGRSPSSATRREATWQDEFDQVGLVCDLGDVSDVGRSRINERLRPDPDTREPRLHIHPRASRTIHQMKRYVWDEYRHTMDRDLKQKAKPKDDDDPTMLKYLLNADPSFRALSQPQGIFRRRESAPSRTGTWRMGA